MVKRRQLRRAVVSVVLLYLLTSALGAAVLCELAIRPLRRPVARTVSVREIAQHDYGASVEDATVSAVDSAQLHGWLVRPPNYNQNIVIILHGVADNRLGAAGFAGYFLPAGYGVLLPDSRGHGDSGGAYATFGVLESGDIRRWIDWLERSASPRCVYLLGESMGAAIAIQATAADSRICATVAESSFATFREVAYERLGQMSRTGPWLGKTVARPIVELAFVLASIRTGVSLADASPKQAISATRTPILLIHGAADSNISPSNSKALLEAGGDHVELWIVPRAEHCGASSVQPEEFRRRVLNWFQNHTKP